MAQREIPDYIADRNAALLSLDLTKINAYLVKYGSKPLPDDEIGWNAIHKARSAIPALGEEECRKSREWLTARGYSHWGDQS